MFPSTGGRRLVPLIRHAAAAAAASGTNNLQPHSSCLPHHHYCSSPLARAPDPDTASYLVASCGLSPAAAAAALISRGVRIHSTARADAVLALLRRYGFSDAQMAQLLRMYPRLLVHDPDKIILPKLEFFASLGVPFAILSKRIILGRSLDKHLVPSVDFLRGILGRDANIRKVVTSHRYGLLIDLDKSMRPALEALHRHGITDKVLSRLVILEIGALMMTPSRIDEVCKDLEAIGLPAMDSRFPYAFRAMSILKRETWLRKVEVYRSFGVSEGELLKAFKSCPSMMLISEENITKTLRFLLGELKLEVSGVMGRPVVMGYSLEKCILPRCAVLSVLMRVEKIEKNVNLLRALLGSSQDFSAKYVLRYAADVPDVIKAYEGKIKFEGFWDQMI